MIALGMLALGGFVGFLCIRTVMKIEDWQNPLNVLTGVLAAAISGGLFAVFERFASTPIGDMIFYYPIGLAYGALCAGLNWVAAEPMDHLRWLHVTSFAVVTLALSGLMVFPSLRALLP